VAGVIGLRGPDIEKRDALRGYKVEFKDADRPYIRPHTGLPVLTVHDGKPVVERHVFGFARKFASFNARMDKLDESPMWKRMWGKHHGVAPVSYILEWSERDGVRTPYRIELADGAAMAVPALVGPYWEDRSQRAAALVTIEPNAFIRTFHDRMIGQLSDAAIDVWLHPEQHDPAALRKCLEAPPDDELVAHPLRADVGKAKYDDADALAAVGPPLTWATLKTQGRRDVI
jgi:putative SOS response-associated peptidase YedK